MRLIIGLFENLKSLYFDGSVTESVTENLLTEKASQSLRNVVKFQKKINVVMGGDLLPSSIFFIFKYDNKHNELLPKTCLKIVFAYYLRSYEHFKS